MSIELKKSIFGVATILLLISCDAQATLTLTDGLVAHYSFDGDASDSSGNGNDGTVYGAQLTEGRFNQAYLFDGQNDYIQVSRDNSLEPSNELTISLWAHIDPSQPMHARFLRKSAHQGNGYIFAAQQNNEKKIWFMAGTASGNLVVTDTENHNIYAEEWHHFTGVYNQSTSSLFIDGELVYSVDHQAGSIVHDDVDLYIGNGLPSPFGEYYRGLIDDVGIWNRALSEAEIKYISENPIPEPATLLLLGLGGLALRRRKR